MSSSDKPDEPHYDIEEKGLVSRVEQLDRSQIDELPFGAILLDAQGKVRFFSKTEARQSGVGDRETIGLDFFTELAPCMGSSTFVQYIEQARRAGTLDIFFLQVGDFADATRRLRVRVASAAEQGLWVFIQRLH